jgi:predicted nucleic-acid-binding protein
MIGVDTNVLVRFLVKDDPAQFEKARKLIGRAASSGEPVLVSMLVLLETEWVLRSRYEFPKSQIVGALSALLETSEVTFEDEPGVEAALYTWKDSPADFADCLIGAHNVQLGCTATATFDTKATRLDTFVAV